jgi:hypothetical protein
MAAYLPPGWPAGVHPPDTEDFEPSAVAWLLDVVPPDYRLHGVLRRYPLALAAMAARHAQACVAGARDGYRTARTDLGSAIPAHALDSVLAAYRTEGRRLVATARAVDLVARALRGEPFTPRLEDSGQAARASPAAIRGPAPDRNTAQPGEIPGPAPDRNTAQRGEIRSPTPGRGPAQAGEIRGAAPGRGPAQPGERARSENAQRPGRGGAAAAPKSQPGARRPAPGPGRAGARPAAHAEAV